MQASPPVVDLWAGMCPGNPSAMGHAGANIHGPAGPMMLAGYSLQTTPESWIGASPATAATHADQVRIRDAALQANVAAAAAAMCPPGQAGHASREVREVHGAVLSKATAMLLNTIMEGKTKITGSEMDFDSIIAQVAAALSHDGAKANVDKFLRAQEVAKIPRGRRQRAELLLRVLLKA